MRQVAAIAALALRNTFRSRVVLVLFALIFAAGFLLPLGLRSDGTPEGLIRLHLAYTLGIATFLLALASLWAGCAAISQEADDKTLQLLLVKPVPRLRIWLGKWFALLAINALLLTLVGGVAAITLRYKLHRGGFDAADLAIAKQTTLASLQTIRAPLPDIEYAVWREYEQLRAAHRLPDAPESVILNSIRQAQLARLYSAPPGSEYIWNFGAIENISDILFVQFKCASSIPGAANIAAVLSLNLRSDAPPSRQRLSRDIQLMPGVPQTVIFTNLAPLIKAAPPLRYSVTFDNPFEPGATLFFDPADGLVLRQPAGTFAGNFLRALAALYLRLALFAAIGVTLGTLFSMPVASFLALVLVLILQLAGFISAAAQVDRATFVANVAPFGGGHVHGDAEPAPPSLAARATATVLFYAYRGTWLALRPLLEDGTLDDLSTGSHLPPRALARALLHQGLLLPLLLALLSTAVLRQREWALPSLS